MSSLVLKPGREKSLLRHHPWVYSGAVERKPGKVKSGETIQILDSGGRFLALGSYNEHSQIISRVWTWNANETIDSGFFRQKLNLAIKGRQFLNVPGATGSIRLVHAESDGIPGLVVDRYADVLVVQFLASGVDAWRDVICDNLMDLVKPESIYERSDVDVRKLDGLEMRVGLLRGKAPLSTVRIVENALEINVDVYQGHKTGYYLDQRMNRIRVREYANGMDVLDCFCYSGGFGINALEGGARSVMCLDSSADALRLCRENYILNGYESSFNPLEGDTFYELRRLRDQGRTFDLIILDPPKFARSASMVEKASRGYKDINLLALKLLRDGGYLFTFSCSGVISEDLFQKIVAGAALDAGVNAKILERLQQSSDHPVALNFPEGAYLKGFIIRVG